MKLQNMKNLANFIKIIDRQTIAVTLVALVCTYACLKFGITVDLPFELVAVAIVFPIVFTISSAFQRREGALAELAEFRANLMAMFLAHRDWQRTDDINPQVRAQLRRLHDAVRDSVQRRDPATTRIVYGLFSNLSLEQEAMRNKGRVSTSELARLNQYLRNAIANFEKLRNVADYRTPVALRAYTQVFLNVFPVLFAPYFALVSSQGWWPLGFVMAILYSLVLVGLDNIQEGLENPFDGLGIDDIQFDGADDETWFESAASVTPLTLDERATLAGAAQSH
jgi:predicted membrane chloride channel (bestrophin family)